MGFTVVNVVVRGSKGEYSLKALVDTGFYGDLIVRSSGVVEKAGIDFKHERARRLPDGKVVKVRYGGGEIELMDAVTYGDVEVWSQLRLPEDVEALIGVTTLEKLGFKVDPKTGRLEKVELYIL
ncbi:MAG: hypothetical protein QXH16_08575 [Candidatus Bathyarchaeia archaeon]